LTDFLTPSQIEYLRRIEVPPSAVLGARRMRRAVYQDELKRQGKSLAVVADPCNKGHEARLRLSSGHCAQCSPIGLSCDRMNGAHFRFWHKADIEPALCNVRCRGMNGPSPGALRGQLLTQLRHRAGSAPGWLRLFSMRGAVVT
jgi:hypothetical protein